MSNEAEDFNMADYSDYLPNFPFMGTNPPPPQSNSIGESPEGSDVSGSTVSTGLGQSLEIAGLLGPLPTTAFDVPLLGTGIDMQQTYSNGYSWQFPPLQALSAFSGQDWSSAAMTNPRFNESGLREVQLHRFTNGYLC